MKLSWKNISISYKIFGFLLAAVLIFTLTIAFFIIPTLERKIINERKETLKGIVAIATGYCSSIYNDYEKGLVDREEMEKRIRERIRSMKYGPEGKDYLWINDMTPRMIMHPFNQALEGKDLNDYADPTGKKLFVEMVSLCTRYGKGFVDYQWQYKDEKDRIVPKISYVQLFNPLGYIIGTGVYIEDIRETVLDFTLKIAAILVAAAALIAALIFPITRSITGPIKRIMAFAGKLADGDFTGRLNESRGDEMGHLAKALNRATEGLAALIGSVVGSAQSLVQSVNQISSGNQNLSQRTVEQASSLEEIASTIEETMAAINRNAENAARARDLTTEGMDKSRDGNRIAIEAVTSIIEMNESSNKVARIIEVINEIAFQTNLLALNAAVEAARAGEQGRGFAVVAGEVRNLAQRSRSAAREIEDLIRDTIEKVDMSSTMVNKTGNALTEIAQAATVSAQIISEISVASQEQKQGIGQINTAIAELDTMTQQNASLVEETASASEEMAGQANELLGMVRKFRIGSAAEAGS